ncbi:hypothetical protein HanPSC8_Chr02g0055761 [Helianthus annuus]|nr:hypothetical protein HanIR_Chr02g0064031 [Helianthus annuus]KAJ0618170.1 hypothetical protein HanHA89_Chr02g0050131 [Helianthus annuus]KAJ0951081.1 hypothetical protein HanPSC8_Chr02g0055761 [Helianthus annuus]
MLKHIRNLIFSIRTSVRNLAAAIPFPPSSPASPPYNLNRCRTSRAKKLHDGRNTTVRCEPDTSHRDHNSITTLNLLFGRMDRLDSIRVTGVAAAIRCRDRLF